MISPATSDDAAGAAALLRIVYPGELFTEAGTRYRIDRPDQEARRAIWKAEAGSALVGWAVAALNTFSSEPGRGYAAVAVHPEARGRGLGTALWDAVAAHLDAVGAHTTTIASRDDEASARFATRRGLVQASTDALLVTDPRTIEPAATREGIDIEPLSAFADDPEAVYRCEVETTEDEPGPFDHGAMTFERWRRHIWDHPDVDRELSMAAIAADGLVVGTTFLCTDRDSRLGANGGTGVLRAYRGRGLGLAMKQVSLARAADAGITSVVTHNNETNASMLAINRRLGYQPFATGRWWSQVS